MNINTAKLESVSLWYPIGNTPPVCLTQDLPLELQDVDILLLGCGDARNILFTCFSDNGREKIDVTCCDIEPLIHARNVLLYTLLIDDEENQNIELIWNLYHNWKIDGNSLELLESQTQKLLEISKSIDQWHSSIYGSTIRFCDENSLSCVRSHWLGFTSQGLTPSQQEHRLSQLQAAIDRAKAFWMGVQDTGFHSIVFCINPEAIEDLNKVFKQWWDCGAVPSSNSTLHLNPAFLFLPACPLILYFTVSPLGGTPLSTAFTPVSERSALCVNKNLSSVERLVNCAKRHLTQWALAFRRSVKNGSKIRIFSGDALAFCLTLRNCQLTQSTSMNLFCHSWTSCPLILHDNDYGPNNNVAPLSFDIIDTSNLIDFVGPLNLIAVTSTLLKHLVCSCLYTELLVLFDSLTDRLNNLFGVDVRTMSLLFGLVPPDLFTNFSNSVEYYLTDEPKNEPCQARSRLRWKRTEGCQDSISIEASKLAKLLIQVHDAMFKLDDLSMFSSFTLHDSLASETEMNRLNFRTYNRASFAFLVSIIKANVVSDWDECVKEIHKGIFSNNSIGAVKFNYLEDLALSMHLFGVDDSMFHKPDPVLNPTLASILPKCESLPDELCVTVKVKKSCLSFFGKGAVVSPIICSFEGRAADDTLWFNSFSSIQIVFGELHKQTKGDDLYLFIKEDSARHWGSSDMFVSVFVQTSMLISLFLKSKQFTPLVKCGLRYSLLAFSKFGQKLGRDLCFSSCEITSSDVIITRFMPGMSGLPTFAIANSQRDKMSSDTTVANLSHDGSKINSLVKRVTLKCDKEKSMLAKKCSAVDVKFTSPLTAIISIASSLEFKLEFPAPVSLSKYTIRVARKSSYIEVESPLLNPLEEEAPFFLSPTFLLKTPGGSTVPAPWTATRIDLDVMPSLDLKDTQRLSWLSPYIMRMFSLREEYIIRESKLNSQIILKKGFVSLFSYYTGSGSNSPKQSIFGLTITDSKLTKAYIFPSCLRLDLANSTIVLDCAFILLTNAMKKDPLVFQFLHEIRVSTFCSLMIRETENIAWKAMIPALIERCRKWRHTSKCEYILTGEVPLSKGLTNDELSFCSCGIGKFPTDYLEDQMKRFSTLNYILNHYAIRVALSPMFAIPYIEDCDIADLLLEICNQCGSFKRKHASVDRQSLFKCSKCKTARYCSVDCQKAHWQKHKLSCANLYKMNK